MWGPYRYTHRSKVSVSGIWRPGEFGGRGSFLWRKSQGRKRGHPTKTLDRKEVPGFGPGMRGGKRGQPLDEGAEPAGLPARGWAMLGRGESPFVPPRAPCKPPAHRPSPLPSSPWAGCPLRPRAPSRAEPRAEAKWCGRVGVSLKPCSYGAAPHRDQRALGSATPPSFPTRRSQGTSEGKIQTQKQQAGEGSPPSSPPPPSQGCSRWDRCPSAWKGTDPGFVCLPVNRQGLSWSAPAKPWPSAPYALAFTPPSSTAGAAFNQGRLSGV